MCVTYADEIRALYGIDIQNDDLQVHPNKCPSCYRRFINIKHTDNNHSYVLVDYSHIEELRAIYWYTPVTFSRHTDDTAYLSMWGFIRLYYNVLLYHALYIIGPLHRVHRDTHDH